MFFVRHTVRKQFSIVIPAYNEEESILLLYDAIKEARLKQDYEIIFINDGSTDNTQEVLEQLYRKDKDLKVINFRKNLGKTAAWLAGFKQARGDVIITLDADLQNDPSDIPKLLHKVKQGYDAVNGWRYKREDPLTQKIPSLIFNWLARKITGIELDDINCGFKAFRRDAVKNLPSREGMHRYILIILFFRGLKIKEIRVKHHARRFGKSKYSFGRLFKGMIDLILIVRVIKNPKTFKRFIYP